jgi:hypothetical protein
MRQHTRYFVLSFFLLTTALAMLGGCGQAKKKLPPLTPVHGRVQYKDGRPVTAGQLCFQSETNSQVMATAIVGADGTFTLSSFIDSERQTGAMAGPHHVELNPPGGNSPNIVFPGSVTIEPDKENNITLVMP